MFGLKINVHVHVPSGTFYLVHVHFCLDIKLMKSVRLRSCKNYTMLLFLGLHKFAEGLSDFRDALVQCDETVIVKDLTEFIKDLIACTEGNCVNFAIDVGLELVILYEHIYEIYGDIQGASNCLKIDAYEQGTTCYLVCK